MFNSAKLNSRLVAAALGALAIGTFAFSGSAAAAPVQLFPFFMTRRRNQRRRCRPLPPMMTKAPCARCRRA